MRVTWPDILRSVSIVLSFGTSAAVPAENESRSALNVYAEYCAGCHGQRLQGGKGPELSTVARRPGVDDHRIAQLIHDGVADSGMPAFGNVLTAADIRALVVLLREAAWPSAASPDPSSELSPVRPAPGEVAQTELHAFQLQEIASGFDVPWAMAFLPDGRLLVTERHGTLLVRTNINGPFTVVPGTPKIATGDEAGLFDIVVDPDYRKTGWIYLSYSDPGPQGTLMTRIVRGRIRHGRWLDQQSVSAFPQTTYTASHAGFGARMLLEGPYLFFSVGDRHNPAAAQDLRSPAGKVHRVFRDGSIPKDNPFAGDPGAVASIWTLGHRNPQGLACDPVTGLLWESEHGPRGGDELNLLHRGRNYGWPTITYGINYDGTPVSEQTALPGMEQPVMHWTPSIAVSALTFYTGQRFPRWQNSLFVGSLARQQLWRLDVVAGEVTHSEPILANIGRIRAIETGTDGLIYLALESPGRIVALVPVA